MYKPFLLAAILLGVLLPFPAGAQGSAGGPLYTLPDKPGDVTYGKTGPPAPAGLTSDAFDLIALRVVTEDGELISLEVEVKDLRPLWNTRTFLSSNPRFSIEFRIPNGDSETVYRMSANVFGAFLPGAATEPPATPTSMSTELCIRVSQYECYNQPAQASLYWRLNKAVFTFTKPALLGDMESRNLYGSRVAKPVVPRALPVGTPILFKLVTIEGSFLPPMYDEAPASGETPAPYLLSSPMANDQIKIYIPKVKANTNYGYGGYTVDLNNTTTVAVTPEATSVIPIEVLNRATGKRIVELGTEFLDPGVADRWGLQIVKTLEIPRGESRTVNLIVNATAKLDHRETATLKVHARSLGFPGEVGLLRMELQAALPPSPKRTTLYWHGAKPAPNSFSGVSVQQQADPQWINVLQSDPRATADEAGFAPYQWKATELDTELSEDLVFDTKQPVKAQVRLSTPVPQQITVRLRVMRAEEVLGEQKVLADLSSTPTNVQFSFFTKPDMPRVKAGNGRLALQLSLMRDDALNNWWVLNLPALHPKESRVDLPLIEDPLDALRPSVPKVFGLHATNDTQEFVNPGKTRRYEVVLVNEGTENETAILSTVADRSDWQSRIEPASKYRLKPGESVTVAVFVKARSDATEGEQLRVDLLAQAERDERAVTRLPLLTVAISTPDMPDQSGPYNAKQEDLDKRADKPGGESPAPGWILAAALLAVFALRRRRRSSP